MRKVKVKKGLSLVELLVALSVSSIILTAVATLAFALSSAYDSTEDTSFKQTQIRFTTLKLSDLIKQCRLVCADPGNDIVIWKADNNPEDGKMDIVELAYIEAGNDADQIKILEFTSCPSWINNWFINLSYSVTQLQFNGFKDWLKSFCETSEVVLIPECSNVQFQFDQSPPQANFVSISFELVENETTHEYRIDAALRSRAANLLNSTGTEIVSDDD